MNVNTRIFGEVEIDEAKIICFVNGIVGFPELTDFALVHDVEKEGGIRWLQSLQETEFAMPVIDPLLVMEGYNPVVEDEMLKPLGNFAIDDILVLSTVTVPSELTKMTVNLCAPIIINAATKKAIQIILDGNTYAVKYPVYDILQARKAGE